MKNRLKLRIDYPSSDLSCRAKAGVEKPHSSRRARTIMRLNQLGLFAIPLIPFGNPADDPNDVPTDFDKLDLFIRNITDIALGAAGFVALVFIFWGGYLWITSSGDPGQVDKGKKTLIYAIAGLLLVILSGTIVRIIITLLNN